MIENVSVPEEVERALDKRTQMGVIGNLSAYTQYQTAEAIEKMAENPNAGGNGMGMIAGIGMGNIMGGAMQGAGQQPQPQAPQAGPPPLPTQSQWYAAINDQQAGPFTAQQVQAMVQQGQITRESLVWKQGMAEWTQAGQVPDLANLFGATPPPLPPKK